MALVNFDNSNTMTLADGHDLSDLTSLTGDLLHTPNTPHGHFFNQGSSLLSDSSPLVRELSICAAGSSFPSRTRYHLHWSSGSVESRQTSYFPVATAHSYSLN